MEPTTWTAWLKDTLELAFILVFGFGPPLFLILYDVFKSYGYD